MSIVADCFNSMCYRRRTFLAASPRESLKQSDGAMREHPRNGCKFRKKKLNTGFYENSHANENKIEKIKIHTRKGSSARSVRWLAMLASRVQPWKRMHSTWISVLIAKRFDQRTWQLCLPWTALQYSKLIMARWAMLRKFIGGSAFGPRTTDWRPLS